MSTKKIKEETLRVAYNFRRLRKLRGLKSKELAKIAKVTPAYISNVEKCVNGTSLGRDTREKFAKLLNVDVSEFLKPVDISENQREIELLKEEVERYSADQIKYLRSILPLIIQGAPNANINEKRKK